ncbi:MAG: hypothetical protein IH984_05595 [Planctomycetes bacterium]|nr:hypothetical protein [Planctomycetota bacterium]
MKIYFKCVSAFLLSITLCSCGKDESAASKNLPSMTEKMATIAKYRPEAMSLLGKELKAPYIESDERTKRQAAANQARAAFDADPESEEKIIWYGRRTAYLGQYNDAVIIYSDGLFNFPDSYRLLRHRGHRFITRRQFSSAIKDLERAAELIEGVADEVEPDGMPNEKNIPRSTTHSNIYYHLGLARYLSGDYSGAAQAYRKNLEFSKNDDMLCANTYWLYLSLRKLGEAEAAKAALVPIESEMDVIENFAYYKLLRAYQSEGEGDGKIENLLGSEGINSIEDATLAYGVGAWHLLNGDIEQANEIFEKIVDGPDWPAFGHIAAEVAIARTRK